MYSFCTILNLFCLLYHYAYISYCDVKFWYHDFELPYRDVELVELGFESLLLVLLVLQLLLQGVAALLSSPDLRLESQLLLRLLLEHLLGVCELRRERRDLLVGHRHLGLHVLQLGDGAVQLNLGDTIGLELLNW